ncbi:MAG: lysophospholipase, partial [Cyanobacteria bacterium]|nr:lysophospholipase [Cyanobacteriota bacterium]
MVLAISCPAAQQVQSQTYQPGQRQSGLRRVWNGTPGLQHSKFSLNTDAFKPNPFLISQALQVKDFSRNTLSRWVHQAHSLLFGETLPLTQIANTKNTMVQTPSGRMLSLRQWWPANVQEADLPKVGNPVLIIPGLGGKTDWGTPMVSQMINGHPLVYGIDSLCFGPEPTKKGHLKDRKELIHEIKEAVELLKAKHGKKVFLIGVSLGGLASTSMVSEFPKDIAGLILIAPAFKPAKQSFKPIFYIQNFFRYGLEKLGLISPKPVSMPYKDDSNMVGDAPAWLKEAHNQVSALTATSLFQIFMMTRESFRKAAKVDVPVLGIIPELDTVCSPQAMAQGLEM